MGLSGLPPAHHSCLRGLWVNNSNSDANGLRQNCRRCLFLHRGVSIKFYWLLPKCRAASCYRSGLGLLQVANLGAGGSKPCRKQHSINTHWEGEGEQSCNMSTCLVPNLLNQVGLRLKAVAHSTFFLSQVDFFFFSFFFYKLLFWTR